MINQRVCTEQSQPNKVALGGTTISNEQPWISEANKRGHYRRAIGSSNLFLWNMQARACLCPRKRGHSLLYSLQDYGSLPSLIFNKQSGFAFTPPPPPPTNQLLNHPCRISLCFPRCRVARLSDYALSSLAQVASGHNQREGGGLICYARGQHCPSGEI